MNFSVKVSYDKSAILEKITKSRAFVEKGWAVAEKIAIKKYNLSKKLFFKEFKSHSVTKEINRGAGASNTSGLLGGEANLFSFFGFDEGADPIGDLENYLEQSFHFRRGGYRNKQWTFRIQSPDKEITEKHVVGKFGLDYTGESWLEGVEKGYSGLQYYLRFRGKGRSGGGIQSSAVVNEVTFKTTKYLSEMLANFKKNIEEK